MSFFVLTGGGKARIPVSVGEYEYKQMKLLCGQELRSALANAKCFWTSRNLETLVTVPVTTL